KFVCPEWRRVTRHFVAPRRRRSPPVRLLRLRHRMHPCRSLCLGLLRLVEVFAGPGNALALRTRKSDLKQLQSADAESDERSSQVEPPGSYEFRIEFPGDFRRAAFETIQPVFQGLGVMQAQVFHVAHREIPRLENFQGLP